MRTSGDYVPVGDQLVPAWLDLELAGDAASPTVRARVEVRDGAPRVTRLSFDAGEAGEVRQHHIAKVQIDALVVLAAGFSVRIAESAGGGVVVEHGLPSDGDVWPALETLRKMRNHRRVSSALLSQVAEVYRANMRSGPTKAVREHFFVSQRRAGQYVSEARAAGLLPPTKRGRKNA